MCRLSVARGDDVQRSIELLDKVLSEYDEHEIVEVGEGGVIVDDGGGGGGCNVVGGGIVGSNVIGCPIGGGISNLTNTTDCSSSTEPSIGLTPDDESPSLGENGVSIYIYDDFYLAFLNGVHSLSGVLRVG